MVIMNDDTAYGKTPVSCLRDKRLSLSAKGLYAYICSCAPNFHCTIRGFASVLKESRGAIGRAANQLEELGYLKRTYHRDGSGKFSEVEYVALLGPEESSANE